MTERERERERERDRERERERERKRIRLHFGGFVTGTEDSSERLVVNFRVSKRKAREIPRSSVRQHNSAPTRVGVLPTSRPSFLTKETLCVEVDYLRNLVMTPPASDILR